MSFDIFDFGPTIAEIDRIVAALQERILVSIRRRLDLSALSESARNVMASDDTRLIAGTADDNHCIEELYEMKKKIRAVMDLPMPVKSKLYAIYRALGVVLDDFAARVPICYEGLLMEMSSVISESNGRDNSADEKREKARDIYKKYELLPLPKYYRWICAESTICAEGM
jgi:hypothetical protein